MTVVHLPARSSTDEIHEVLLRDAALIIDDLACNTIWALTDFTQANGVTLLMPGSQHLPDG